MQEPTMLSTPLTEMLGVQYPVMLAGMAGVSYAEMTAAVSEAGGYGVLGAAGLGADRMREEMARVRDLTDRPFGVDLLTAGNDQLEALVEDVIEGGASTFVAGLGVPTPVIDACHQAGLLVISMCGKVEHAKRAQDAGCDIVVAQGTEAGGHTGSVGGMALMPQIVDAVQIPVVGAGGIFDGRGLVAALALGCVGIWMGTRFIASVEARATRAYKDGILRSRESDTVVSRCWTGKPLRAIRNRTTDDWEKRPQDLRAFPLQALSMHQAGLLHFNEAELKEPDSDKVCMPSGQGCGGIREVKSCREIIEEIVAQAGEILRRGVVPAS